MDTGLRSEFRPPEGGTTKLESRMPSGAGRKLQPTSRRRNTGTRAASRRHLRRGMHSKCRYTSRRVGPRRRRPRTSLRYGSRTRCASTFSFFGGFGHCNSTGEPKPGGAKRLPVGRTYPEIPACRLMSHRIGRERRPATWAGILGCPITRVKADWVLWRAETIGLDGYQERL